MTEAEFKATEAAVVARSTVKVAERLRDEGKMFFVLAVVKPGTPDNPAATLNVLLNVPAAGDLGRVMIEAMKDIAAQAELDLLQAAADAENIGYESRIDSGEWERRGM